MKKQWITVLIVFVILLTMAGCSLTSAVQQLEAVEDRVEVKLEAAEDKVERSLRKGTVAAPEQAPSAVEESSGVLTEEQAQQIALDHLGFTIEQIERLRTTYEIDDGVPRFDIEFQQGDWEYEFEIHAENGKIISYDKDHKYD